MSSGQQATEFARLLRRWRSVVVPVEDPEHAAKRREYLVRHVGACILTASQQRQRVRGRRRWVAGLALAAATCLGIGLWQLTEAVLPQQQLASATAPAVTAPSVSLRAAGGTVVARVGDRAAVVDVAQAIKLRPGDDVTTAAEGEAMLELTGHAQVRLSKATSVRVLETRLSGQRLFLRSGRVDVEVPEHGPKQHLVVETPDAEAHVVGTIFSVELRSVGETHEMATVVNVSRGEVRVIRRGGSVQAVRAGERWVAGAPALAAAADQASDEAERTARPGSKARASRTGVASASELAAQNRMYRSALDARNGGNDAKAVRILDRFLAKYPDSPLAQEAEVERFRTLQRMGRSREAAQSARRYLSDHDSGFAREEARELLQKPGGSSSSQ